MTDPQIQPSKKESKWSSKPKKTLKNTPQAKKFPKSQNRQRESKQARMTERAGLREIPMRCDGTPSGRAESDVPVAQWSAGETGKREMKEQRGEREWGEGWKRKEDSRVEREEKDGERKRGRKIERGTRRHWMASRLSLKWEGKRD